MTLLYQYVAVLLLERARSDPNEQIAGSPKKITKQLEDDLGLSVLEDDILQALAILAEFAAAEQDYNPIREGFWVVQFDNFRYYFIEEKPVELDYTEDYSRLKELTDNYRALQAYGRRGAAYAADVLEALQEMDSLQIADLRSNSASHSTLVPAANRIVTLDHKKPEYAQIAAALDDAIEKAKTTRPNDLSGDEHASVVASLQSARSLWNAFELTSLQVRVGIFMTIERAENALKTSFELVKGPLLMEALKAFFRSAKNGDIF